MSERRNGRRPTRVTAAALATTMVAAWCAWGGAPPAQAIAVVPGFDAYGGSTAATLAATGFFRTQQVDGRWWLVTPDGHPFFSNGVNHVNDVGTVDKNGHAQYAETVAAKYASPDAWADAQVTRFAAWGINTLGGWSDDGLFAGKGVPYTVIMSLAGQSFVSGRIDDLWDPSWAAGVTASVSSAAAGRVNDPNLVGYFTDNELHWSTDWRFSDQFDLFIDRPASSAGKQRLVDVVKARYGNDFSAFAADFVTPATSWDELLADTTGVTDQPASTGARATRRAWIGEVAERYFSVTHAAIEAADPNHLDLGARFITQTLLPEVAIASAKYVDVETTNWYDITEEFNAVLPDIAPDRIPTSDTLAAFRALTSKPLIISEFGYRAADSGLPNTWPPMMVTLATQADRAAAYRNYAQCAINTGAVVGLHWFELVDEPLIGRSDLENSNWGMLTEWDDEYAPVVQAAAAVHDAAYAPLTDPSWQPGACTPVGPQLAAAPPTTTPSVPVVTPAFTG